MVTSKTPLATTAIEPTPPGDANFSQRILTWQETFALAAKHNAVPRLGIGNHVTADPSRHCHPLL